MVKLFTDIDLDGLGCGVIAKMAFGDEANVSYCSHRNLNGRVENYIENPEHQDEQIYITDMAVNEIVERKLAQRFQAGQHVVLIDHHVTALHFNQYDWGIVNPQYDSGRKTCATSLFYDYLREHQLIGENKALEEFIDLVRQYDTWEWDANNNINAKRLNDLFYIQNREKFEEDMLKRFSENPEHFFLNETENLLLDMEENKINRYINSKSRQTVQADIDDYCVGIIHAEQYLSELGNALNKMYPHLDMIAILNVSGKKMGFRTIHDEIDVAEYAKRFGGGGHPKASGCEMNGETFEKFVSNVFHLSPLKPDSERNELNIKEAPYGTSYQNAKGETSFIIRVSNGAFKIIHQGTMREDIFTTFEEAERFLKRKFSSWLRYDQDCLQDLSRSMPIPLDEIRKQYAAIISEFLKKEGSLG